MYCEDEDWQVIRRVTLKWRRGSPQAYPILSRRRGLRVMSPLSNPDQPRGTNTPELDESCKRPGGDSDARYRQRCENPLLTTTGEERQSSLVLSVILARLTFEAFVTQSARAPYQALQNARYTEYATNQRLILFVRRVERTLLGMRVHCFQFKQPL